MFKAFAKEQFSMSLQIQILGRDGGGEYWKNKISFGNFESELKWVQSCQVLIRLVAFLSQN